MPEGEACCITGDKSDIALANANIQSSQITAEANVRGAQLQLQGTQFDATMRNTTATAVETIRSSTDRTVAEIQAGAAVAQSLNDGIARRDVATTQADAETTVAETRAGADRDVANAQLQAAVQSATIDADARVKVADTQSEAAIEQAQLDADARTTVASTQASATVSSAITDANARTNAATTQAAADRYQADQGLVGIRTHEDAETYRLSAKLTFSQRQIDRVLGLVACQFSCEDNEDLANQLPIAFGTAPYISARPVFTPAQIQQQVNQLYARNDARTVSSIRQAQGDLAGRGFSSNSPLIEAIRIGLQGQNLQASVAGAAQVRLGSAQANLDALLHGQELRSTQYKQQQDTALDFQRNLISRQVGVLGSLAQMIAGVA